MPASALPRCRAHTDAGGVPRSSPQPGGSRSGPQPGADTQLLRGQWPPTPDRGPDAQDVDPVPPQSPRVPTEAVKGGLTAGERRHPPPRGPVFSPPWSATPFTTPFLSERDTFLSAPVRLCAPGRGSSHLEKPALAGLERLPQPLPIPGRAASAGGPRCHPVLELRSPIKPPGQTPSASAFPRASAPAWFSSSLPWTQKAQLSPPAPDKHPQERGQGLCLDPAQTVTPLSCRAARVLPGPAGDTGERPVVLNTGHTALQDSRARPADTCDRHRGLEPSDTACHPVAPRRPPAAEHGPQWGDGGTQAKAAISEEPDGGPVSTLGQNSALGESCRALSGTPRRARKDITAALPEPYT